MKKQAAQGIIVFLMVAMLILVIAQRAFSQFGDAPVIIRDTEIENTLKEWSLPLFEAAQISPNNVQIILIQSPQINAFVAGGANIFIYTGLIDKTKSPEELIGVLAHELGHIEGGHLVSMRGAFERASYESIFGAVVGIGAAILTGRGEAAQAVISGSQNIAGRRFLANTRINESAADQAALRYMEASGINPQGLVSFFRVLENQELLPSDQQTEYMRTHPLTRNRIDAVENKAKQSAHFGKPTPQKWQDDHARMKAKLMGFINPTSVPWTYDDRDKTIPATYARAIAAYRQSDLDKALSEMDQLLTLEPDNPYFLELKGQILVDFGRVEDALPFYRKAVSRVSNPQLIRIALGHALLETGQQKYLEESIDQLSQALSNEKRSARLHRLLATAYGRKNDELSAKYHLAEESVLKGRFEFAITQAKFVIEHAPKGSRLALQAQDVLNFAESAHRQKKK